MPESILEQISARAGCSPRQAEEAVAEALRLLDAISVEDPMASTAALITVRSAFGLPACFHLTNLILGWMDDHDDRLMLTETMQRLGGLELRQMSEHWNRELSERKAEAARRVEVSQRSPIRHERCSIQVVVDDVGAPRRLDMAAVHLVDALRLLSAAKGGGQLTLSFNGSELEIVRGVTRVAIAAIGNWPLIALVRTQLIKDLLRRRTVLPERVVLTGTESHVHFSHYSIPCSWVAKTVSKTK